MALSDLFAQATGRIGGTVADSTGAVVPGAAVVCKNVDTGLSRQRSSGIAVRFEAGLLNMGTTVSSELFRCNQRREGTP
jgi:hypothetical protein